MEDETNTGLLDLTVDVVTAYLAHNKVAADQVPHLIARVYASLAGLGEVSRDAEPARATPTAAQVRRSVRPEALISFEDGKPYKALKRHLTVRGLTMADYRVKWGLPSDYPSVAPAYSERRSALAKAAGLGRKPGLVAKSGTRKIKST